MKNKIFAPLFAFLVLAIIFFIVYKYHNSPITKPPERLSNIPQQTKWVGGADGGSWYKITKVVSKNTFKIKIYNEGNGELEIDTTFILSAGCSLKEVDSTLLVKSFNFFDGKKIELLLSEKNVRCYLIVK